jgi:hypothetical protein
MKSPRILIFSLALTLCGAGLWNGKSEAEDKLDLLIKSVPHVRQKPDFCGEACVEMILAKKGHKFSQDQVFALSGVDPKLGRGMISRDLAKTLKKLGFITGPGWYKVKSDGTAEITAQWDAMIADLAKGVPSIVCMHYDDQAKTTEHFRLILGYNKKTDKLIYHEPAERRGAYLKMSRTQFLKLWPLKYSEKAWTLIRFQLGGAVTLPKLKKAIDWTPAQLSQHFMKLKKRIPSGAKFQTLVEGPFVVLGDESATTVRRRSKNTVRWAVNHLKKLYFDKNPEAIIDVWLFKNKKSYEKNVWAIWKDKPGTPFGYYTPTHRALIMNISTGGGTLVHEIVHPFIESNFPDCPDWFNEGLASLYEQCGERNGKIAGFTNWRLAGLQEAIKGKKLPRFKTLLSTSRTEFYDEDLGTNYSQARYLCYYLQENDLLIKFYKRFKKTVKKDPTGMDSLRFVLNTKDLPGFQKHWEKWVMALKYPR